MANIDLLAMHKLFLNNHIREGGVVADFTMGNGHDTEWLARAVGETGRVYAFDIQEDAVEHTRARLTEAGVIDRCTLILDSHANAADYIHEPICAGVFNLGYLPGGDRTKTTLHESTRIAVEAAISRVDRDGIILIAVYPGHPEGTVEGNMLDEMLATLDHRKFSVSRLRIINSPTSPFFFAVERH
ncbi:MAG: methyltransferase domain-containing protein [Clostridia bacterium]|nr:methyltransferase domain-containing protein [Clostridia bacterium]